MHMFFALEAAGKAREADCLMPAEINTRWVAIRELGFAVLF